MMKQLLDFTPKTLWLDCETTGLDPKVNDIWQLAAVIEVGDDVCESINLKMRPINVDTIEEEALKINGVKREEILAFPPASQVLNIFKSLLARYINKFDRDDKFVPAGYCVGFDLDFLRASFAKTGDKFFGSWFYNAPLDVRSYVALLPNLGFRFKNFKLATVCEGFGIEIDAHDALSDIQATKKVFETVKGLVK